MPSAPMTDPVVTIEYRGRVAIITLDNQKQLNALTADQLFILSQFLREVALRDDVFITVLTAKGRFFSAGANVQAASNRQESGDAFRDHTRGFLSNNMVVTQAFYSHPKILVTALNGPAVGISAALIGFSDFIYAAPHAYILTPFSSLGLVAEGGASRSFVQRMGIAKANEALIMSKRISCEELVQCGFVNKVFDIKPGEDAKFLAMVLKEVDDRLGEHLVSQSLVKIKALIRKPENDLLDAQGVAEVLEGVDALMKGVPQQEFRKIATGQKRHKL